MKSILTSLVLASATAMAQQAAPQPANKDAAPQPTPQAAPPAEPTLKDGSEVNLAAVTAAKWIQGEAPKAFEPGKIYLFECWATWCGPCLAAIPHVNDLHKKYAEKGLRVYGMDVSEDDAAKVEKFVKDKGDGMSYPVAFTGKGSAFETEWLKANGARGIPHTFVVKDGKLIMTAHPSQLTESVIESLLAGDEGIQKAVAEINAAKAERENFSKTMMAFRKASVTNDTETMAAKLDELEKIDAAKPYLASMKLDLLIAKKDWPAATKAFEELPDGQGKQMSANTVASKIAMHPEAEYPNDFIKTVSKAYALLLEDSNMPSSPFGYITLSVLQWRVGDKDAAKTSTQKAAELAAKPPASPSPSGMKLPAAPFERFAKATAEGKMPSTQDLSGWLREAMQGSGAVPAGKIQATPPVEPSKEPAKEPAKHNE